MLLLYNIVIRCYYIVIKIVALFDDKARKWIEGRRDWEKALQAALTDSPRTVIWMHCASLGEFEQGRPILEQIRQRYPRHFLLLTFFSPSGYEIQNDYKGVDFVSYLPLDTSFNARRFVNLVQPQLVVFVKYEFWYHFLTTLNNRTIPVLLVSAIFRKEQIFFRPWGGLFRKMLSCFSHLFVQEKQSKYLLEQRLGMTNVTIGGDTRVDRVLNIASSELRFPLVEQFVQNDPVLLCGSTWPADEQHIARWYAQANLNWKLIIAPHDIQESRLRQIEQQFSGNTVRYSCLKRNRTSTNRILIIDNIGMLSALYRYARIAYVGGGFGAGIHSILEPAAYDLPICFGPNYHKFAEAKQLLESGGAFVIRQNGDLKRVIVSLEQPEEYDACQRVVRQFMEENKGATAKVMGRITQEFLFG